MPPPLKPRNVEQTQLSQPERQHVSVEEQLEQAKLPETQPDHAVENMSEQSPQPELAQVQQELDTGLLSRLIPKKKKTPPALPPSQKDEVTKQIEGILAQDIGELYQELPQYKQVEFKLKGEETARSVRTLLQKPKINIKKLIKLLFEWLKLLPGVNRFFIEQEVKIKADRIVELKEELKNQPRS